MNIFMTCAGRRVGLLQAFASAVHPRNGIVVAGDMDGLAPTLFLADAAVRMPALDAPNYVARLEDTIREFNIRLIVPTIDTELLLLANNREYLSQLGCVTLVSAASLITVLRDKYAMAQLFANNGISVPSSWVPGEIDGKVLPDSVIVKPRDGSASKHIYRVERQPLDAILPMVPNPMVQEIIEGQEITVDGLLDLDGRCVHYVPRLRVKVIGGESVESVTIDDKDLRDWLLAIFEILGRMGGIGPMTIQAFLTARGPVLSEINPRFGGGVPLAFASGGHYPEWILQMLEGKPVQSRVGQYTRDLCMTRHHVETFTEQPLWNA